MSLIHSKKYFPSKRSDTRPLLLLCGFGGAIWQTKRLINVLNQAGYDVTAYDFPKQVLNSGDPSLLPALVEEMVAETESEAQKYEQAPLLVGISLGVLISLNILRRSNKFDRAVGVTGGNIALIAKNIFGDKIWPQSLNELEKMWQMVNIWTKPSLLRGKHMIFVLPTRDKLIDTTEVLEEIRVQQAAGTDIQLIERRPFSHIGTIIDETVLHPKRVLSYIDQLDTGRKISQ